MRRLAALMMVLAFAGTACAEIQEFRYFSLDVPEEWSVNEDGTEVVITAPDKSASLSITVDDPHGKTIAGLAEEFSRELKGTPPEKDEEDGESYSFTFNNGVSYAVIDGDEEMYLLIIGTGVEHNADILGKILESLEMK